MAVGAVGRSGARHPRHAGAEQTAGSDLEIGGDEHLGVRLGRDRQAAHDPAQARPAVLDRRKAAVASATEAELALDVRQVATASAGALGVAGLGHEVRDHPVEFQAVIEAAIGQGADALDMGRRRARLQFDQNASLGGVDHPQVLGRNRTPFSGLSDRAARDHRDRSGGQKHLEVHVYPEI
ncbi:hypothetical protein D3C80_1574520 [compost metagenome]